MSFEVISEEGQGDYEVWTCPDCGRSVCLAGTGGDVACCPCEYEHEGEDFEDNAPGFYDTAEQNGTLIYHQCDSDGNDINPEDY